LVEASISVKLKAEGAEDVKQQLLETRAAALGVSTAELEHAQSMRQAAKDAQTLNNVQTYQTRIILAQYPALNSLTRTMTEFGHVSRGVLAITTAFSTAFTAFRTTNTDLLELNGELAQAQRDQALALQRYGYDSVQYQEASEQVAIFTAKKKELDDQMTQEHITNILNFGGAIGIMASSIVTTGIQIATRMPGIIAAIRGFNLSSLTLLANPVVLILAGIAAALVLLILYLPQVSAGFTAFVGALQSGYSWLSSTFCWWFHWRLEYYLSIHHWNME